MLYPEINFQIKHQDFYSRSLLLARYIFGWLYISIPHGILLFFNFLYLKVIRFLAFWITFISGKYPHFAYESNLKYAHWKLRLNASLFHLTDEYPAFGINTISETVTLHVEYPQNISRSSILIRTIFGFFYCYLPHFFILSFRFFLIGIIQIFIVFTILFTGKFPKDIFKFIERTLLWQIRVDLYLNYLISKYPVFSSKE